MLHGAGREERADEHDRGQQPPVPRRLRAGAPAGRGCRGGTPPGQPDRDDDGAGDAGDEGEPDSDRPEVGVDHQHTVPFAPCTRPGYWAL